LASGAWRDVLDAMVEVGAVAVRLRSALRRSAAVDKRDNFAAVRRRPAGRDANLAMAHPQHQTVVANPA
jgi:hypothetical protein